MTKLNKVSKVLLFCLIALCAVTLFLGVQGMVKASAEEDDLELNMVENELTVEYGKVTDDVEIAFTYTGTDSLTYWYGIAPYSYASRRANLREIPTDYYSVVNDGSAYTLTIDKEFMTTGAMSEAGYYYVEVHSANSVIDYKIHVKEAETWTLRSTKGTKSVGDSTVTMNLNPTEDTKSDGIWTDGRAYYSESFDVTKPIFLELDFTAAQWIIVDLNDTLEKVEYAKEIGEASATKVKVLFNFHYNVHNGYNELPRMQGFYGFVQSLSTIAVSDYLNEFNKNVVEFYIGETSSKSYIKINGHKVEGWKEVTISQADFPDGKVYLSLFNGEGDTVVKVNEHPNEIVTMFTENTPEEIYTLKSNTDYYVEVVTEHSPLTVTCGDHVLTSDEFDYDGSILTIYGSYLKTLPYATEYVINVTSGKYGSSFIIPTTIGSLNNDEIKSNPVQFYRGESISYSTALTSTFTGVYNVTENEYLDSGDFTFENGVLTIKKEYIATLGKGYVKLLIETVERFVAVYVVNYTFANGITTIAGNPHLTVSGNSYTFDGTGEALFENPINLSNGVQYTLKVDSVGGYYEGGGASGDKNSFIRFDFYNVETEEKISVFIRPNASEDSSISRKTYIEINVYSADGTMIAQNYNMSKTLTVGTHIVKFYTENGKFRVKFNSESDITVDVVSVEKFNSVMNSVASTNGTGFTLSTGSSAEGSSSGCGSAIGAAPAAVVLVFVAVALCLKRKKLYSLGK